MVLCVHLACGNLQEELQLKGEEYGTRDDQSFPAEFPGVGG